MKTIMLFIGILLAGTISLNAQTKSMVKIQDLPKAITQNLETQHKDWKATEAFKVDTKGVITYEIITKKDKNEEMLWYDNNGKFMKQQPYHNERSAMKSSEMKTTQPTHSSATTTSHSDPKKK